MIYDNFIVFFRLLLSEVSAAKGVRIKAFIFLYRICSFGFYKKGLVRIFVFPFYVIYRLYGEFLLGMELPVQVIAGPGLSIFHGHGLVVHADAKIGARCTLRQGVTIGNKITSEGSISVAPTIGDDVEFGACSVVIGDVTIGSRVSVGACTAVTKDVPDDHAVVGAVVRLIPKKAK